MELVTERLRLRRAKSGDLAALHEILSDPAAMRFWSSPPHRDLEQTRAWLAAMIGDGPPLSDDFVIDHEGCVIGKAGCWRLPEIGFILHPDVWGQGLAREAVTAVIARVFAAHDIPAIEADVDPRNAACLGLLARLGFIETRRARRTWKVGGEWCDSVYLALPRPAGPPAMCNPRP